MKIITRTAAAAMLISLPMALGACGGSDSKPSKADASVGFAKILKSQMGSSGTSDAMTKKIATCVVDKTYDKISAKTLNAMKSGKSDSKGDSKDQTALNNAAKTCAASVVSGS